MRPVQHQEADHEQGEPVPGVILDGRLPDRHHVGRKPRLERMRAKRSESDRDEEQDGGDAKRPLRFHRCPPAYKK